MTAEITLTAMQLELLNAIRQGVEVTFTPFMGRLNPEAFYRRRDTSARCTATAKQLLGKGLVERFAADVHGSHKLRAKAD